MNKQRKKYFFFGKICVAVKIFFEGGWSVIDDISSLKKEK